MPPALQIKKGQRFGRLVVIREMRRIKSLRSFECQCDCGRRKRFRLYNLTSGNSMSCGCAQTPTGAANPNFRHGVSSHHLYQVWYDARRRCTVPDDASYKNYGARGISMCDEWLNDPWAFVQWGIAKGWEPGLEIDREDNDGNYTPDNCRFVTHQVNSANRRPRA